MNKKGQMQGLVAVAIAILVIGVIGVSVVIPTMIESIDGTVQYASVNNESVTLTTNVNDTLAHTDLQTLAIKSQDGLTTYGDTNYWEYLPEGKVALRIAPFTSTHVNFTSNYDTNVTFSSDIVLTTSINFFNCTNHTQIWIATGNFTAYSNGKINVLSTGALADATEYCMDYSYSIIPSGSTLYAYYTYAQDGYTGGLTATIVNLLPVIFAIVLLVGIIGYIGFKA
jgi:hypothetical protein